MLALEFISKIAFIYSKGTVINARLRIYFVQTMPLPCTFFNIVLLCHAFAFFLQKYNIIQS